MRKKINDSLKSISIYTCSPYFAALHTGNFFKNVISRVPLNNFLKILVGLFTSCAARADQSSLSLGGASANAMEPLGIFTNGLYNICYILGVGFILGSIIRFKEYRQNPSQTPISRPIAIFCFGLIFIAVPIIAKLSSSSIK